MEETLSGISPELMTSNSSGPSVAAVVVTAGPGVPPAVVVADAC